MFLSPCIDGYAFSLQYPSQHQAALLACRRDGDVLSPVVSGLRLPLPAGILPTRNVRGRQQTAMSATRVDTLQVAQVHDLTIRCGGMADNGHLAGVVPTGKIIPLQGPPEHRLGILLSEWPVGKVVGMDKEMVIGFVIEPQPLEKCPMFPRHEAHRPARAIRVQGNVAAELHPEREVVTALPGTQHHLLVIAHQGNQVALAFEPDQLVQHTLGIRAAINVVAQSDQRIRRPEINQPQEGCQGLGMSVDVTDGNDAIVHAFL